MSRIARARPPSRGPFLWRLGVSAVLTLLGTAALAAGAGAAMRAGWFRLRGISDGQLTLYVALASLAGVLFQLLLSFVLPLILPGPRVTVRARLKFLLAAPLLVAAAAGGGYLVLPSEQREAVDAAAGTMAGEAAREARAFDARAEAERAEADLRAGRPPAARAGALLVAILALAGAAAAAASEVARWVFGRTARVDRLRRREDGER